MIIYRDNSKNLLLMCFLVIVVGNVIGAITMGNSFSINWVVFFTLTVLLFFFGVFLFEEKALEFNENYLTVHRTVKPKHFDLKRSKIVEENSYSQLFRKFSFIRIKDLSNNRTFVIDESEWMEYKLIKSYLIKRGYLEVKNG